MVKQAEALSFQGSHDPQAEALAAAHSRSISHAGSLVDQVDPTAIEAWLGEGDLSKLTPAQRVSIYRYTCESLGLNPLLKPFEYLWTKPAGEHDKPKLVLYPTKGASEQVRRLHEISLHVESRTLDKETGLFTVHVKAWMRGGREVEEYGVVAVAGEDKNGKAWSYTGQQLANRMMLAVTKAYRRATYALVGLGGLAQLPGEAVVEEQEADDGQLPVEEVPLVQDNARPVLDPAIGYVKSVIAELGGAAAADRTDEGRAPVETESAPDVLGDARRMTRAELRAEYVRRAHALSALEIEFSPPLLDHDAANALELLAGCRTLRVIAWEAFLRLQQRVVMVGGEARGLDEDAGFDVIAAVIAGQQEQLARLAVEPVVTPPLPPDYTLDPQDEKDWQRAVEQVIADEDAATGKDDAAAGPVAPVSPRDVLLHEIEEALTVAALKAIGQRVFDPSLTEDELNTIRLGYGKRLHQLSERRRS